MLAVYIRLREDVRSTRRAVGPRERDDPRGPDERDADQLLRPRRVRPVGGLRGAAARPGAHRPVARPRRRRRSRHRQRPGLRLQPDGVAGGGLDVRLAVLRRSRDDDRPRRHRPGVHGGHRLPPARRPRVRPGDRRRPRPLLVRPHRRLLRPVADRVRVANDVPGRLPAAHRGDGADRTRGDALRRHSRRLTRHDRADQRRRRRSPCSTAINLYTRDADVSALDEIAADRLAGRPPRAVAEPLAGGRRPRRRAASSSAWSPTRSSSWSGSSPSSPPPSSGCCRRGASGHPAIAAYNSEVRERFAHPAEFPVLAALGFGVIVYSFSRIMLSLSKDGGPVAFGTIAALVLGAGFLVAFRRNLGNAVVAGVAAVAVLALVAGGVAAALVGEREIHAHETIDDARRRGRVRPKRRSRPTRAPRSSVADKASLFAEMTLREDDTLVATELGVAGEEDDADVPARQPDQRPVRQRERRGAPARARVRTSSRSPTRSPANEETLALMECTPLVEEGGSQLMTFTIGRSSLRLRPVPVRRAGRRRPVDRGDRAVTGTVTRRARRATSAVDAAARRSSPWRRSSCSPACADNAPQDTWQPEGDNAQKIHDLQWPVFAIAGVVVSS